VTISALGKQTTVTIVDEGEGFSCYGDGGFHEEGLTNFISYRRKINDGASTGDPCVAGDIISSYPDSEYNYRWGFSIFECSCEIYFEENSNISDVYAGIYYGVGPCGSSGNYLQGCCVCDNPNESAIVRKQGFVQFPISGYGTYNVNMPFIESHFPFCNAYDIEWTSTISVVLSPP
jgi:hypothetical protein